MIYLSDEFVRIATKELTKEIFSIAKILQTCQNDLDVKQNRVLIKQHFHKIKGLSPMMGQEEIGELAVINEKLISSLPNSQTEKGICDALVHSNNFMKEKIVGSSVHWNTLKISLENKFSDILK